MSGVTSCDWQRSSLRCVTFGMNFSNRDTESSITSCRSVVQTIVGDDFSTLLRTEVNKHHPEKLIMIQPGDHRVLRSIQEQADNLNITLEIREDNHFYCGLSEFEDWAKDRKRIVLEDYYRHLRKKHNVLMTEQGEPVGGEWNYDSDNRESFGKSGPGQIKTPRSFRTDEITDEVIELVEHRYADHPGTLAHFGLPVTHSQARALLRDFIKHRLQEFGKWQDAVWTDRPFLYHSRTLFRDETCICSRLANASKLAVEAYEAGKAPINSVEGFVRQILGWREFVRGIYWREMPQYIDRNALRCGDVDVPQFLWDGETDNVLCRRYDAVGYQAWLRTSHPATDGARVVLPVCWVFHPRKFHDWHMAMYVDAIDWVSLPNTLGMSQYGDGGIVGTKPYCASGNYINKMSNCCSECPHNYRKAHRR